VAFQKDLLEALVVADENRHYLSDYFPFVVLTFLRQRLVMGLQRLSPLHLLVLILSLKSDCMARDQQVISYFAILFGYLLVSENDFQQCILHL